MKLQTLGGWEQVVVGMDPAGTLRAAGNILSVDPAAGYTEEFGLWKFNEVYAYDPRDFLYLYYTLIKNF